MIRLLNAAAAVENNEIDIIAVRLLTIIFWWIFPILTMFFVFLHLSFFSKRIFVECKFFSPFYPYNKFFHNILFVYFWLQFFFITAIVLWWSVDFFIFKNTDPYTRNWNFLQDTSSLENVSEKKIFLYVVWGGWFIHLINVIAYSIYNLLRTDSYFALNRNISWKQKFKNLFFGCFFFINKNKIQTFFYKKISFLRKK